VFRYLVGVREATHAAHDAQHVVVDGVHAHLRRAARAHRVHGHRELESGLVDAREVARARRLVLLRLERKRVHADARRRRRARVVLVRLHVAEVAALALREAVLAVELQLGDLRRALAGATRARVEDDLREQVVGRVLEQVLLVIANRSADVGVEPRRTVERRARLDTKARQVGARRAITRRRHHRARRTAAQRAAREDVHDHTLRREVVGVVERLAAVDLSDVRGGRRRAVDERVTLAHPHQLLHRVVEVQLDLVRRGRDRLGTRELQLLDQVLVRLLGEAATLLRVQVDVVDVQRRGRERLDRRRHAGRLIVAAVDELLELHVDAHLVVLEGDERDRQARIAAEPELQRDVERARRRARAGGAGVRQLGASAGDVQRIATTILHQDEVVRVADHLIEGLDRALILRELGPDLHPVAILAVDALAANLELNRLDEAVADVVEPAEAGNRAVVGAVQLNRRENHLDVRTEHQVGVTVDDRRHALVEVGLAVERHLDGLHREVRVTLEQHLPERDLGVAGDIDVLRTVRDELKKTTTHVACMIQGTKIFPEGIYTLGDCP